MHLAELDLFFGEKARAVYEARIQAECYSGSVAVKRAVPIFYQIPSIHRPHMFKKNH